MPNRRKTKISIQQKEICTYVHAYVEHKYKRIKRKLRHT